MKPDGSYRRSVRKIRDGGQRQRRDLIRTPGGDRGGDHPGGEDGGRRQRRGLIQLLAPNFCPAGSAVVWRVAANKSLFFGARKTGQTWNPMQPEQGYAMVDDIINRQIQIVEIDFSLHQNVHNHHQLLPGIPPQSTPLPSVSPP